jgi:hypothetical protein
VPRHSTGCFRTTSSFFAHALRLAKSNYRLFRQARRQYMQPENKKKGSSHE